MPELSTSEFSASDLAASELSAPELPVPDPQTATMKTPRTAGSSGSSAKVIDFPQRHGRRLRRTVWITAAAVVVTLAVITAVVLFSPLLALKSMTIDGNKMVSTASIVRALAPLKNKPLPQVNQDQVQKLLVPLQQIRSVSVEARPPSTLLVHVVERVPVAVVKNQSKSGKGYVLVDQDGVPLGTVPDPAKVSLPLIDGGIATTGSSTFTAITTVLSALPAQVLSRLQHASASSPDAVTLTLTDGKTVVWGNASDKELKAKVLQALLKAPAPVQQPGQPAPAPIKVYDVSAPRHPVTR
ncbi:FtsQ-type POTRA domain-containing protein [Paenarthrobacter sp. Z7-10]|nr:FtsQ-type POTRA domain-containing protein [Paenarthrobacter sp. Z7-10]